MNNVVMMGRLVEEPEQSYTISGKHKVKFSIAVSKKFKKEGKPTADFFDCEAWEFTADKIFKYFHKGDSIIVRGRMENDNYVNKEGQKVYGMVLKVEEFDFGQKKLGRGGGAGSVDDDPYFQSLIDNYKV